MMSLLGTDPDVAFDRLAPFENRQLSYLAKFSLLVNRRLSLPEFEQYKLRDLDESVFGPPPWIPGGFLPYPRTVDFFPALWGSFSLAASTSDSTRYYAEKTPSWMRSFVSAYTDPFTIHLFRDPRDNFISSVAFMRKRGDMVGFGRAAEDSDETFVRTICFSWINFYIEWSMNRNDPRALMVRYEDFAIDPEPVARTLSQTLNLNLDPAAIQVGDHHRSAASVQDSVSRHRAEPLPPALLDLFDEYLAPEMATLNYTPNRAPRFPRIDIKPVPAHDGAILPGPDRAIVQVTGPDFFFHLSTPPFEAYEVHSLWVAACASIGDHCSVYWRGTGDSFSEERVIHLRYFSSRHWRVFNFDFSKHPLWSGTIAELRLDLFNFTAPEPAIPGSAEVAWYRFIQNTNNR